MTLRIKRQTEKSSVTSLERPDRLVPETDATFDPSFLSQIQELAATGLTPATALALITQLIAATPGASREAADRIKTMDKLVNTARAMMETRLKNEEATAIASRLDEMELLIERLGMQQAAQSGTVEEIWDDRRPTGGTGEMKDSQDPG